MAIHGMGGFAFGKNGCRKAVDETRKGRMKRNNELSTTRLTLTPAFFKKFSRELSLALMQTRALMHVYWLRCQIYCNLNSWKSYNPNI